MTTQICIKKFLIIVIISVFGFCSCKKENTENLASLQQLATDETDIQGSSEDLLNDADDVLSGGDAKFLSSIPCGTTLDSLIVNDTIIYTLTFNGLNCSGNRFRSGVVKVFRNINDLWSAAGTTVRVEFINFRVTRVLRNRSYIINGIKYYSNISGGLIRNLGNGDTVIIHQVTGNMQATFDNNTTRIWNLSRKRTFRGVAGQLILTTEGTGFSNGYGNLSAWGVTRSGEQFYVQIAQPVLHRQECGWDPVAGEKIYQIPSGNKRAVVTFGYGNNNQPVPGNLCPERIKVCWEINGRSGSFYIEM